MMNLSLVSRGRESDFETSMYVHTVLSLAVPWPSLVPGANQRATMAHQWLVDMPVDPIFIVVSGPFSTIYDQVLE